MRSKAFVLTTPQAVSRLHTFYRHAGDGVEPELAVPLDDPELKSLLKNPYRPGQLSNWMSFRNIMRKAEADGLDRVTVFEDDAVLAVPYMELQSLLKGLPGDFDLCYIGGYFRKHCLDWSLRQTGDGLYRIKGRPLVWGKHAVVYGRNVFRELGSVMVRDIYLSNTVVRRGNSYLIWPQMAQQSDTPGVNGRFDFKGMEEQSAQCIRSRVKQNF